MKILVLHGHNEEGLISGENTIISQEKRILMSKGHIVKVVMCNKGFGKNPFALFWSFRKIRWVKNAINSFDPDIIHFHLNLRY